MAAPTSPTAGQNVDKTFWDTEVYNRFVAEYAAWTSFTPGWFASTSNPSLGNGTSQGKYNIADASSKTVDVFWRIDVGSTTTFGSGAYEFQLPNSWNVAQGGLNGFGYVFDSSAGVYYAATLGVVSGNNNRLRMRTHAAANASATVPVTLATGDIIAFMVRTEIS